MPKVELVDPVERLNEMATALIQARQPTPLGAFDGYDLRNIASQYVMLRDIMIKTHEALGLPYDGCIHPEFGNRLQISCEYVRSMRLAIDEECKDI
jgi:hypothetical protein